MAYDAQLKSMQEFIADSLQSSGEFRNIAVGHSFSNPALDHLKKRNIFAEKKPGFADNNGHLDYLIVAHADSMPINSLRAKTDTATENGIPIMHVLYKMGGTPFFEWDKAIFKPGRADYDDEERRAMINTKEMERYVAFITGNRVPYFSPFHGLVQTIGFKEVVSNYEGSLKIPDHLRGENKQYHNLRSKRTEVLAESEMFTLDSYWSRAPNRQRYRLMARVEDLDLRDINRLLDIERGAKKYDPELAEELGERIGIMIFDGLRSQINRDKIARQLHPSR